MTNGPKSPCFGCEERFPACHDTCGKYKAFKIEDGKEKEKLIKWQKEYSFGTIRIGMTSKDFKYQARKTKNKVFKGTKK